MTAAILVLKLGARGNVVLSFGPFEAIRRHHSDPFALLVPATSPHRLVKRWPAGHYRALAAWLMQRGITPVVVGAAGERTLADAIGAGMRASGTGALTASANVLTSATGMVNQGVGTLVAGDGMLTPGTRRPAPDPGIPSAEPCVRDLTGQTSFGDLAELGRTAAFTIGNDTGPMHLLAAVGCPSMVPFSRDSDPARCAPRAPLGAPDVRVLRRDDLAMLTPAEVIAEVTRTLCPTLPAAAEAQA